MIKHRITKNYEINNNYYLYKILKQLKVVLTSSQAENKIRQGIEQAAQTVKQRLESS